jgi:hypothetical protein
MANISAKIPAGMTTHEDIAARLDKGDVRFVGIENKLDALSASVESLTKTVEPIRDDISVIKEMTGGWRAIGTAGRFAKWIGGVVGAIVALWAFLKITAKAMVGL